MKADQILESEEFRRALDFHGHLCPGLTIGYRAASEGMRLLGVTRAPDEELVAIVENDACGVDAVQTLTGCTFGKGNFIFRDYGKQAFTLYSRRTGRAVRLALKAGALEGGKADQEVFERVRRGEGTEEDKRRFAEARRLKIEAVLELPLEKLFSVEEVAMEPPEHARVMTSEPCAECGEPTMPAKMADVAGRCLCAGCAGKK